MRKVERDSSSSGGQYCESSSVYSVRAEEWESRGRDSSSLRIAVVSEK